MTLKNITVYYQKDWNPYAKYTEDFSKTHTKVFEGTITNVENQEDVFSAFNNDYANPLSYTNETNQVCVIGKNYGNGKDFQKAMKLGLVDCHHKLEILLRSMAIVFYARISDGTNLKKGGCLMFNNDFVSIKWLV